MDFEFEKLWANIETQLNDEYHKELWTENLDSINPEQADYAREAYYIGLNEYLDNECSSEKHHTITQHLVECRSCRDIYLTYINLNKALAHYTKYTLEQTPSLTEVYTNIHNQLFTDDIDLLGS